MLPVQDYLITPTQCKLLDYILAVTVLKRCRASLRSCATQQAYHCRSQDSAEGTSCKVCREVCVTLETQSLPCI